MGQEELKPGDAMEMTEFGKSQFEPPYTGTFSPPKKPSKAYPDSIEIRVIRTGQRTGGYWHRDFWRKRGTEAK